MEIEAGKTYKFKGEDAEVRSVWDTRINKVKETRVSYTVKKEKNKLLYGNCSLNYFIKHLG